MRILTELKLGESAVICDFSDESLALKLTEMGCMPGQKITFVQVAPFGCPLIYKIDDSKISMRIVEAQTVLIN